MYDRYGVNLHQDVRDKGGLTLSQIIEAGLTALGEPYDSDTFYVYPAGSDD